MQEKYVHKKMSHDDPIKSPFNLNRCKKEKHIYPNKENTDYYYYEIDISLFFVRRGTHLYVPSSYFIYKKGKTRPTVSF